MAKRVLIQISWQEVESLSPAAFANAVEAWLDLGVDVETCEIEWYMDKNNAIWASDDGETVYNMTKNDSIGISLESFNVRPAGIGPRAFTENYSKDGSLLKPS